MAKVDAAREVNAAIDGLRRLEQKARTEAEHRKVKLVTDLLARLDGRIAEQQRSIESLSERVRALEEKAPGGTDAVARAGAGPQS